MLTRGQKSLLSKESSDPLIMQLKKQRAEVLEGIETASSAMERSNNIFKIAKMEKQKLEAELGRLEHSLYLLYKAEEERGI